MVVIGHQAIGNHTQRGICQYFFCAFQQEGIVAIIGKDTFAVATTVVNVVVVPSLMHGVLFMQALRRFKTFARLFCYCRAMIWRISASSSLISSPLTSTVTLSIVPVNSKGGLYSGVTGEPLSMPHSKAPPATPKTNGVV
mgnify:CR=1 FL=1